MWTLNTKVGSVWFTPILFQGYWRERLEMFTTTFTCERSVILGELSLKRKYGQVKRPLFIELKNGVKIYMYMRSKMPVQIEKYEACIFCTLVLTYLMLAFRFSN